MKRLIIVTLAMTALTAAVAQTDSTNMKPKKIIQTAGRTQLGDFAPEFARANDDILFGEVWNRNDLLSLHDRSIVTVVALMSQGLTDSSLRHHLEFAKANGVTRTEIAEAITHAAFYAGWPKAWAVFRMAKEVWGEATTDVQTKDEFQASTPWPIGAENSAYAKYFVGQSYLAPISADKCGPSNVTFEPRCRNNWHIHHGATQVLICVAGRGWYQEWGKEPVEMTPGTVIAVPAEVKHWHGAAADSWFQHLTYHANVQPNSSNEWLEPVDDATYNLLK